MFHLFGLFPLHGAASRPPWWSMWSFGTIANREKKPWHIHQSCCHRILLQELQPNLTNSLSSVTSDEDAFLVQTGNGCAHIRCARSLQGCCSESCTGVFKSWTQTADKELKEKLKKSIREAIVSNKSSFAKWILYWVQRLSRNCMKCALTVPLCQLPTGHIDDWGHVRVSRPLSVSL